MNTIIIPTDFSETAYNALEFAVALALKTKQSIHLIHTYLLPQKTAMLSSIEQQLKEQANIEMAELLVDFGKRYPSIKFNYSIHKSTVAQAVSYKVKRKMGDLVVMGTHGTNKFRTFFLGSNAIDVMNKSRLPVLMIPEEITFNGVNKILLTLDKISETTIGNLKKLKGFAEITKAQIVALHVERNPEMPSAEPYRMILSDVFGDNHVEFYELEGKNVKETIDQFAFEIQADVICTLKQEKGWLSKLTAGSLSKKMIYSNKYPLLVLNQNVEKTKSKKKKKQLNIAIG